MGPSLARDIPKRTYTGLIITEIHQAITKLGGSARPATPTDADRELRDLGADIDLISIVDSWQDTLPDEDIPALNLRKVELVDRRRTLGTGRLSFRHRDGDN